MTRRIAPKWLRLAYRHRDANVSECNDAGDRNGNREKHELKDAAEISQQRVVGVEGDLGGGGSSNVKSFGHAPRPTLYQEKKNAE